MKKSVFILALLACGLIMLNAQASESFTYLPTTSSSSYLSRSWTGDNAVTWTAVAARTDQTINGKAICWNGSNGNVVSPTYSGGMGTLTFKYVRAFTGTSARSLEVYVNNNKIGETITVSPTSDVVVTYSNDINISGDVVLKIQSPTGSAQVKLDDISWTGYSGGSAPPAPIASSATNATSDTFTANWGSATGASGYYLDVYTKSGSGIYASDLFISEYIEGSSSNKGIEIFNGTGVSKDLSLYRLQQYNNGSSTPSYTLNLSGTLADGSVYRIVNSSHTIFGTNYDLSTSSSVMTFNGDDALVLNIISSNTNIDIFGRTGEDPGTAWTSGSYSTLDQTLVRKSSVYGGVTTNPSSGFPTLTTEWDHYPTDTTTYFGSHTFEGGTVYHYVTGYSNKDVGNVLNYPITGLSASTTYYYRVRAYNAYGTSGNSNEISVTTLATPVLTVDPTSLSDFSYIVGNGPSAEQTFTLTGTDITADVFVSAGEYWEVASSPSGSFGSSLQYSPAKGSVNETVRVRLKAALPVGIYNNASMDKLTVYSEGAEDKTVTLSGHVDEPLPIVLSSFTASISAQNYVTLTWVTQTETGMAGYYIYRALNDQLSTAQMVSPLIDAVNGSQQHIYSYTDSDLYNDGTYFYWLESRDIDGNNHFFGPISIIYDNSGEYYNPEIPLLTEL